MNNNILFYLLILYATVFWSFRLGNLIALKTKMSIPTFLFFMALFKLVWSSYA